MIFSKFFKSNWQHKDASVRVLAVNNELSLDNDEQHKILTDLLNQDESELVRRAVLLKLNNFDSWLMASKENSLDKVRNFAAKQVNAILFAEHEIKLSLEQKLSYIATATDKSQLEAWLVKAQQPELVIALLEKIAKPQLLTSVFTQKANEAIQHYVVDQISDAATLERLFKKAKLAPIKSLLEAKLSAIVAAAEKPVKLKKTTQLVLSKLLSLKELADFEVMLEKKTQLLFEWQQALEQFECLSTAERDEFLTKFDTITSQLDKVFAQKAEAFEQEKIVRELHRAKAEAKQGFELVISELSQQLATAIFNNDAIDENSHQNKINELAAQINASVLDENIKQAFAKALTEQSKKLSQLPIIAESVTEATHLISKVSQLAPPTNLEELNSKLPSYDEWQQAWKKVEQQASGFLPASISDAKKEITKQWQLALKPLFAEQRQLFSQTQKKMADVNRLINTGKFNAAFGVFKRVESYFARLDTKQQLRLQREHESLTEKISELSDWEHYIATPRKQQLLTDILQLVETPLDNPKGQAAKVKEFRAIWNSLGHADDEIDKDLNHQFNLACEQAFAPCRLFYAEQEKLREQHQAARTSIVEQAKLLVASFLAESENYDIQNWKNTDGQLNKLQQQWRDAGEVDREVYKQLQQNFNDAIKPLKAAITQYHTDNAKLKRALIAKVEAQNESEDVFSAVNQVKTLQAKWKNIGYAGSKEENKLWQNFRKANDAIFAKRDQQQSAQKDQQSALQADLEQQLAQLKASFEPSLNSKSLTELTEQADALLTTVYANKPVIKAVAKAVESFISELKKAQELAQQGLLQLQWQQLFTVLEALAANENIELDSLSEFTNLPQSWQKKIASAQKTQVAQDRGDKTLELEILAGVESPKELLNQRLAVQVTLMQNQMLSGGGIDLSAKLFDWLLIGAVKSDDLSYIQRLKPIYCH